MGCAVEYQTFVRDLDGTVKPLRAAKRNLILDSGLNMVASNVWSSLTRYCAVGTSTDPIKRDSGAITFTRAGNVVTASANFFEAGDVGRLLKFDTGEEMKISTFTDVLNVIVDTSGTLGAAEGTIYYVNRTGLAAETARTGNMRQDGGDNGSSFSVDTWTFKRTFLFPAVGANVTYNEIGWSPSSSPGANLFGMDLISGGDSLLTGQQYIVIVRFSITLSPTTGQAVVDVGNNGFNTSGTAKLESVNAGGDGNALPAVGASGEGNGFSYNELGPSGSTLTCRTTWLTADFTQGAVTTGTVSATGVNKNSLGGSAYTPGTFFRDFTSALLAVNEGNGLIYGLCIGAGNRVFSVKFTSPQTKLNTHTLQCVWRLRWNRVLQN